MPLAPYTYRETDGERLARSARVRLRKTGSGFLVPCKHRVAAPFGSPMGRAIFAADSESSCRSWIEADMAVGFVDSRGVAMIRAKLAREAGRIAAPVAQLEAA